MGELYNISKYIYSIARLGSGTATNCFKCDYCKRFFFDKFRWWGLPERFKWVWTFMLWWYYALLGCFDCCIIICSQYTMLFSFTFGVVHKRRSLKSSDFWSPLSLLTFGGIGPFSQWICDLLEYFFIAASATSCDRRWKGEASFNVRA